ncbi:hypothetical protein ACQ4LE_004402 [Meloidogyne hapla]
MSEPIATYGVDDSHTSTHCSPLCMCTPPKVLQKHQQANNNFSNNQHNKFCDVFSIKNGHEKFFKIFKVCFIFTFWLTSASFVPLPPKILVNILASLKVLLIFYENLFK